MFRFFVPVTRSRVERALCLGLLAVGVLASCTTAPDTEAAVPSKPGAVQPEGSGSFEEAEDSACAQLTQAEAKARSGLGCDAVKRSCPDYIRPVGSEACFKYDQGSVSACAKRFEMFTSCDDFEAQPCLVTARSCDQGEGGAGGAPSDSEGGAAGALVVPADAGSGG